MQRPHSRHSLRPTKQLNSNTPERKARTAEFADEGRRGGGGLKNGDLLIASKVRSIHFTDDGATTPQIMP
jgi:hypothetical protein